MHNQNSPFPNGAIKKIIGRCLVLKGDDIDTDRIIPARFLKCVSFEALGKQVFADDRLEMNGFHPFDLPTNQGASILIVNDNFGCGSSREHAPQALMRWGVRAIIGQSFAEIFYGNCLSLGIPCATAEVDMINNMQQEITIASQEEWDMDLALGILKSQRRSWDIKFDPGALDMLLTGRWDGTSQLISHEEKLDQIVRKLPYLNNFPANK